MSETPRPLAPLFEVLRPYRTQHPQETEILHAAITRRAWLEENKGGRGPHHEPLEWLGDRMLGAVVAEELWRRFPHAEPGRLDLARDALTSERPLAEIARELELLSIIRMGVGERQQGQVDNDKVLSDHVEAFIGAAFLVTSWDGVRALVQHLLAARWPAVLPTAGARTAGSQGRHARTALNERVQARFRENISKEKWSDERLSAQNQPPVYRSTVVLPDGSPHTGQPVQGKKADARSSAAEAALRYLDGLDDA